MRSKYLLVAFVGVLSVTGTVAWAVPASETTLNATFTPASSKAGTLTSPLAANLKIRISGGTTTGRGQPATSTAINITLPRQWKLNSERWPRRARCDIAKVNQSRTDSVCPAGSRIGSGSTTVQGAASDTSAGVTRTLFIRAYVIKNGDLGLFIQNKRGETPTIALMIQGVTSLRRKISIKIPKNLQEPVTGVATGIRELQFTLRGTALANGKRFGVVETIGCPKSGQWLFTLEDVYRDGRKSDSDTAPCRR